MFLPQGERTGKGIRHGMPVMYLYTNSPTALTREVVSAYIIVIYYFWCVRIIK